MTAVLAAVFGAGAGAGLLLVVAGIRGRQLLPDVRRRTRPPGGSTAGRLSGDARRRAAPVVAGLVVWGVSGWVGLGVIAGCAVVVAPRLFGAGQRKEWIARSEAIAAWAEMLRDTMVAADGVEGAIAATVPIAPLPIRSEVALLDARRRSEATLPEALTAFAAEVRHPTADLVVTALVAAAEGEGSDFTRVLGRLATVARAEVATRQEIEAGRAQVHTSGRMILAVLLATAAGFGVVSRDYFEPYATGGGQLALVVVAALFTAGAVGLERMSRITVTERFVPRRLRSAEPAHVGAGR